MGEEEEEEEEKKKKTEDVVKERVGSLSAGIMFSVRIVTADHYVSHPISGLDALQSSQLKVPVIRIFGATPAGQSFLFVFTTGFVDTSSVLEGRRNCCPLA